MSSIKSISFIAMIAMTIISFSNFFGLGIAGLSVLIGILFFFIDRTLNKQDPSSKVLNLRDIRNNLKDKSICLWIGFPLLMNLVCFILATLFLPEFIEHTFERTQFVLSADKVLLLVLQLALLAFGEEIAWRGFFQRNLSKMIPIVPALIVTSILFSIGHFAFGNTVIVTYDIFFIFINSILYGIVFYKTNNVWLSAFSHFIANLFAFILMFIFS
ncbi:CPBP family intramembrane glutamic endopeptidase [Lysinibacillus antri]|uniref:CPBP family intramembrane metalloprotease n=1 Tax=Lysinibacillus antri TaxID=2498145 RepID=A0A432L9U0_9BACI|nr:type II CAAX endopeptidase family protein [Lysinibacillus antri]RUL50779.1 CPBP family intramembrane metalloprotease [Lysinibacillus antri]